MNRSFSDTIIDVYDKIRVPLISTLMCVAFLAHITSINHAAAGALLAAGLLSFRLVVDIYKKTTEPPPSVSFETFDAAAPIIEKQLLQYFRSRRTGNIRYLGMVLYHLQHLERFFNKLVELPRPPQLLIEIVMLNPEWDGLDNLSPAWRKHARASAAWLETFQNHHEGITKHGWTIDVKFYETTPCWYGFLIDDEHLFLGTSYWDEDRLRAGYNPVYQFRPDDALEGHKRIAEFNGWFNHYANHSVTPSDESENPA